MTRAPRRRKPQGVRRLDITERTRLLTWLWLGLQGWTLLSSLCRPGSCFCSVVLARRIFSTSPIIGSLGKCLASWKRLPWGSSCVFLSLKLLATQPEQAGMEWAEAPALCPVSQGQGCFTPAQLNTFNEVPGGGGRQRLGKGASLLLLAPFTFSNPAFNVSLNSVSLYADSLSGPSCLFNNHVPSGSFMSGVKLVSRDTGVSLT